MPKCCFENFPSLKSSKTRVIILNISFKIQLYRPNKHSYDTLVTTSSLQCKNILKNFVVNEKTAKIQQQEKSRSLSTFAEKHARASPFLRWPRRDITLTKINGTNIIFYYHFHSNFVQTITSIKKYYILLKMNTHFLTKNVQHVFTKPLKTLRAQVNARRLGRIFQNKMAEDEEDLHRLNNFDREGLPNSGSEREIIEYYFHKGFEYKNIVLFLQRYHGIRLSERTLKWRLTDFGLKRRQLVDENVEGRARDIIKEELSAGPDRLNGYRTMWHILRLRHHINVPRQLVASIMKEVDPEGVQLRKRRRLHRRTYVSPGPKFAWHADGYDKLKPYGFSIHGCIDDFSRRILWLQVQRSNKNPKVIARYFFDYVKATEGCPIRLLTDRGTENGLIAAMQCYLRANQQDEFSGSKAVLLVFTNKATF